MGKKTAKRVVTLSSSVATLVASASGIGYDVASGFASGVKLVGDIMRGTRDDAKRKKALNDAGAAYKVGYALRYLEDEKSIQKRWGNMDRLQRLAEVEAIFAKPTPDSSKPNRRTELEHKACRAADTSWSSCKRRAGIAPTKAGNRSPRPSANEPAKAPPVDLVKASPKLASKSAVNDYFQTAAAALLATVDKNARLISPQLSSAVSDFKAAIAKALGA